jgi:hypothetical protein
MANRTWGLVIMLGIGCLGFWAGRMSAPGAQAISPPQMQSIALVQAAQRVQTLPVQDRIQALPVQDPQFQPIPRDQIPLDQIPQFINPTPDSTPAPDSQSAPSGPPDARELIPIPGQGQGQQPGQGQGQQPGQGECPIFIYQDGQLFMMPQPGQQPGQGFGPGPGVPGGSPELIPLPGMPGQPAPQTPQQNPFTLPNPTPGQPQENPLQRS